MKNVLMFWAFCLTILLNACVKDAVVEAPGEQFLGVIQPYNGEKTPDDIVIDIDDLTEEEQRQLTETLSNASYQDHIDKSWTPGLGLRSLPSSYRISTRYTGRPYAGQVGNSCQAHAGATAMNAWWQKKNDYAFGPGVDGFPHDWQRSPYYIYNMSPLINYWTVSAPLNVLKYYGATHLKCFPEKGKVGSDPAFGLNTYHDIVNHAINNLALRNFKDPGAQTWAYVNGSNQWSIPSVNWGNLDLDQIKKAVSNKQVVLLRFALVDDNNMLPLTKKYDYRGNSIDAFKYENKEKVSLTKWHVVAIIGYDNNWDAFYCQNSWGANAYGMDTQGAYWMTYETVKQRADQAAYILD